MTGSAADGSSLPLGWDPAPGEAIDRAKSRAIEALERGGEDPVGPRLARYYDRRGNYAGSSFAGLFPNDP